MSEVSPNGDKFVFFCFGKKKRIIGHLGMKKKIVNLRSKYYSTYSQRLDLTLQSFTHKPEQL